MRPLAVSTTLLRTFPLFARFSDAALHDLLPRIQHRTCPRNSSILRADEKSHVLYAIVSGKVKIVIHDGESREATLTIIRPGELFGEMSCIDGKPRSASVVALDHCEVLTFRRPLWWHASATTSMRHVFAYRRCQPVKRRRRKDRSLGADGCAPAESLASSWT